MSTCAIATVRLCCWDPVWRWLPPYSIGSAFASAGAPENYRRDRMLLEFAPWNVLLSRPLRALWRLPFSWVRSERRLRCMETGCGVFLTIVLQSAGGRGRLRSGSRVGACNARSGPPLRIRDHESPMVPRRLPRNGIPQTWLHRYRRHPDPFWLISSIAGRECRGKIVNCLQ